MSMRISSALPLLALAACGSPAPPPADPVAVAAEKRIAEQGRIACARGDAALERSCTVEQMPGDGGTVLTVRHADGGFRRLRVTADGQGVAAADGAEPARVTLTGDREIEVAIGDSRYRLPATQKAATAP
jgi:hypothetical protein